MAGHRVSPMRGVLRTRASIVALTAAALLLVSADGATAADAGSASGQGTLRCAGADTMRDLLHRWADGFRRVRHGAKIIIDTRAPLSADGFVDLLAGRADCVSFARELFPSEDAAYAARFGVPPLVVPVAEGSYDTLHATHAIAIYVNSANPLTRISLRELGALFAAPLPAQTAAITRWGQLGLKGKWANRPIHLYGMLPFRPSGNPPGIVNFLERRLLGGHEFRSDAKIVADRSGDQALQGIVESVAADPDGIGYSGFGFAKDGVRALALCGTDGACVAGTPRSVASGHYPLHRTIYLAFPRTGDGRAAPISRAFLHYVLSAAGQAQVRRDHENFLPLPPARAREVRGQIDARARPVPDPFGLRNLPSYVPGAVAPPLRAGYIDASGAIHIVGYNDMRQMLAAIDTLFTAYHPGFRFSLDLKGTRTAPAALMRGTSAMAPMGADFEAAPLAAYRHATGGDPLAIRVAHDALDPRARSSPLAVYVGRDNPLSRLTKGQLAGIFAPGSGAIRRWGQLDLAGQWRGRAIHLYGMAPDTPLAKIFVQRLFPGHPLAAMQSFGQSRAVIAAMAHDPQAIGFADLNQAIPELKVVALAACDGCASLHGSAQDLVSGRYLLDRTLTIFVRKLPGEPLDRFVREYLRLVLSRQGQAAIAAALPHYLPLNSAELHAERAKLD